ncbi:MAG TPA: GTPase [Pyrinomonadaceae bacterium]|jgi:predicted GTPase|nr:GTPase [Pyrinomonadaceae bacterium]
MLKLHAGMMMTHISSGAARPCGAKGKGVMSKEKNAQGVNKDDLKELLNRINKEVTKRPPVIGLIGVSGVGKSSTINTLFKTNLETSDTVACTKEFKDIAIEATFTQGSLQKPVNLVVIDAPGLGEDIGRDPEYLEMYRRNLPRCDVILWVMTGRNRAVALDQQYLQALEEFHGKMVFGVNQVDLIEPVNWDRQINLPSSQQRENIKVIIQDRREKLQNVLRRDVKLIPYSAKDHFNLSELFSEIVASCPPDRKWVFSALQGFSHDDFIPAELREEVRRRAAGQASSATPGGRPDRPAEPVQSSQPEMHSNNGAAHAADNGAVPPPANGAAPNGHEGLLQSLEQMFKELEMGIEKGINIIADLFRGKGN